VRLDGVPKRRPQLADCFSQNLLALLRKEKLLGIWRDIRDVSDDLKVIILMCAPHRNLLLCAILSQVHQCGIDGDACQPGCKLRPPVETLQMKERLEERVLNRVLGIFSISRDAMNNTKDLSRMTSAKFIEGGPLPNLGCRYESLFFQGLQILARVVTASQIRWNQFFG
jgi:hypothetical protein